jgi:putative transposase
MTSASDRQEAMTLIRQAVQAGARHESACQELGLSARTLQRWHHQAADGRPDDASARRRPTN